MPLNAGYLVVNNYMMHPDLFLHILLWCNRRCTILLTLPRDKVSPIFSDHLYYRAWYSYHTMNILLAALNNTQHFNHIHTPSFIHLQVPLARQGGKKATLMQYLHGYFWRALCIRDFISRLMPYAQPTFTIRAQLCTWDTYTAPISFWNSQRGHRIKMPDPRNRWRRNFLCNGNVGRCST